jgi:hypothetical protein
MDMKTTINHELSNRGRGNNIYRLCKRRIIPTTHPIIQTPDRKLFGLINWNYRKSFNPRSYSPSFIHRDCCWNRHLLATLISAGGIAVPSQWTGRAPEVRRRPQRRRQRSITVLTST